MKFLPWLWVPVSIKPNTVSANSQFVFKKQNIVDKATGHFAEN